MTSRPGICRSCGHHRVIVARGWCTTCNRRWVNAGRPKEGPPPPPVKPRRTPWIPLREDTRERMEFAANLASRNVATPHIAWRLGLSERQVQRYLAAWRELHQQGRDR